MSEAVPPARDWLVCAGLWASIGLVDAYRMGGSVNPIAWSSVASETALLAVTGLILGRLGRGFANPAWVPAVLACFVLVRNLPTTWVGVPYVLGVLALTLGPAVVAVRRGWNLPALVALACVPLLHVCTDTLRDGGISRWTWPLRHRALAPMRPGTPIVLVSVDTLRADSARTMAVWKRLSAEGAWWSSAMSTSSWTLPSVATILTGLPPDEHGAVCLPSGCQVIAGTARSIAEDLDQAGWRTVGVTSNPWLSREAHFDKGFQRYFDFGTDPESTLSLGNDPYRFPPQRAEGVTEVALRELEHLEGASFLWVHYIDPHWPYGLNPDVAVKSLRNTVAASEQDRVREAYAAEVALVDRQVTRLLDAVHARFGSDVHVLFTADHGEELWEHDGAEHGHSHHAEVVEVPLVLSGPSVERGQRAEPASLADIAPTIRYLAGLSKLPSLAHPRAPERELTAYGNYAGTRLCSARDARRRVIVHACDSATPWAEAFDLRADPGEHAPERVSIEDPLAQRALSGLPDGTGELLQTGTEALEALGYVQ
ncbi:MAG: sulfatase [Myxococcota bacterium]